MKAVSYLAVRGHKKIILALPLRYNMNLEKGYRERAYKEAVESNGLVYDESLICGDTASKEAIFSSIFDLVFAVDPKERPTAIVAGDDYLAGHIMQYLKKLGLQIPDDLAIVGMDNMYLAEMVSPPLTSIDFSKKEFSRKLVDTMLKLIREETAEDEFINVSLMVREST